MADSKISELLPLAVPADNDLVPIVDMDESPITTKYITRGNLVSKFGANFQNVEAEAQTTTTSLTFVEKLSLLTPDLPLGNYFLTWYFELGNDNDKQFEARVQQNDTTNLALVNGSTKIAAGAESQLPMSGHKYLPSIQGIQQFDIDYRSVGGEASRIRRARLTFHRVS